MSIPNGYRLLTSADVGKTFGTDLESMVYFDEDITPTFYLTSIGSLNLTNFCREERDYLPVAEAEISSGIYLNGSGYIYYEVGGGSFWPTEADLSGVEITSFNTDYNWNNWFYVKDKSDPYNIKIKNKEGIKLLTKDKTIEYTDDVKVTIDESLLGGGEAEPKHKVKYNINYTVDYNYLYVTDGYKVEKISAGSGSLVFEGGCNLMLSVTDYAFAEWTVTVSGVNFLYFYKYGGGYGDDECIIAPAFEYGDDVENGTYYECNVTVNVTDD